MTQLALDDAGNAFNGSVTFTTDSGSAVMIVDTTALDLVALTAASLDVTAGGAVTDSGTLAISGATTISASGQDITLDEAATNAAFGECRDRFGSKYREWHLGNHIGAVTDSGTLAISGQCSGQDILGENAAGPIWEQVP